jgi:hypothetical protein
VRDIEGLQENFSIDDILLVYKNGLLEKWLKVRGFEDYLKKVEKINKKENDKNIVFKLIEIFQIEKSEKKIMGDIYSLAFWNERKKDIEKWEKKHNKVKEIIADYHKGYDNLKTNIFENKFDMPFLKQTAREIYNTYLEIFKIDYIYFFDKFVDEVPLMIFAILMNENLRNMFLENEKIKNILSSKMIYNVNQLHTFYLTFKDSKIEKRKQVVGTGEKISNGMEVIDNYNPIVELTKDDNASKKVFLGYRKLNFNKAVEYIRISDINTSISLSYFSGQTEGYWKDLEPKNKKYMIISMQNGNFVRNAAKQGEELSASDVNGKFPILNGIDYKSNYSDHTLIYMEV